MVGSGASGDMNVCYILDGVLILYGIILTVLYCRLRVRCENALETAPRFYSIRQKGSPTDTYETIKMDKRPIV
uniref:Uncharacterized protein n=1 Tax=Fundulus heteroclitus TaxID=8078 RepID=A0A3Q2NVY2_FUNHE